MVVRKYSMISGTNSAVFRGETAAPDFGVEEYSKIEATYFSGTTVIFCQATLRQAPEDSLHSHRQP